VIFSANLILVKKDFNCLSLLLNCSEMKVHLQSLECVHVLVCVQLKINW